MAVVGLAGTARAESPWEAELRLGYGLAMGSESDTMPAKRTSPITITAIGAIQINDEPVMSAYGGLTIETISRNTFGAVGGVRLAVPGMPIRIAAGGVWVYAPASRWGGTVSAGTCRTRKSLGLCTDLQLTTYIAGEAIQKGHAVTQIQAVFGMVFDLAGGAK